MTGLGVFPAAWSDDPVSCMAAPAGMGRIEFTEVSVSGGITSNEPSGALAAVIPLGLSGVSIGSGAGWNNLSKTGMLQVSGCYVVAGDPIGFMEGLFGPSISTGVSVRYEYADSTGENKFDADAGFQFSLFPSFALGMICTDIIEDPVLVTGFSHVFNRNLTVHAGFSEEAWQVGCELAVTRSFRVFSGTDGDNLNAGMSVSSGELEYSYGSVLHENAIEHSIGVTGRFP